MREASEEHETCAMEVGTEKFARLALHARFVLTSCYFA